MVRKCSFAADKEMSDKIQPISLGQGQGPKATIMINDAQVSGIIIVLTHFLLRFLSQPCIIPVEQKIIT